jgi:hypothetical protein
VTQENLLDAVVDDLKRLFTHDRLANSMGAEREIRVFPQDLPCREGDDEETQPDKLPEPYVLVRLQNGTLPEQGEQQTVKVILVVCVFDPDPNRQGYRDALHIVNSIMTHYGANGVVGGKYVLQYPIEWATQEEETHPYYFAAVSLNFEAPTIFKEVPE